MEASAPAVTFRTVTRSVSCVELAASVEVTSEAELSSLWTSPAWVPRNARVTHATSLSTGVSCGIAVFRPPAPLAEAGCPGRELKPWLSVLSSRSRLARLAELNVESTW